MRRSSGEGLVRAEREAREAHSGSHYSVCSSRSALTDARQTALLVMDMRTESGGV